MHCQPVAAAFVSVLLGHPNCAVALGSTTAALVIAVAVGISAAIARRRSVVVSRLHSTKRGRRFLRAAGFNVRDAMRTYEKAAQLEKRFPDAPFLSIWCGIPSKPSHVPIGAIRSLLLSYC